MIPYKLGGIYFSDLSQGFHLYPLSKVVYRYYCELDLGPINWKLSYQVNSPLHEMPQTKYLVKLLSRLLGNLSKTLTRVAGFHILMCILHDGGPIISLMQSFLKQQPGSRVISTNSLINLLEDIRTFFRHHTGKEPY